jgi:hypothetical protein
MRMVAVARGAVCRLDFSYDPWTRPAFDIAAGAVHSPSPQAPRGPSDRSVSAQKRYQPNRAFRARRARCDCNHGRSRSRCLASSGLCTALAGGSHAAQNTDSRSIDGPPDRTFMEKSIASPRSHSRVCRTSRANSQSQRPTSSTALKSCSSCAACEKRRPPNITRRIFNTRNVRSGSFASLCQRADRFRTTSITRHR